MTTAQHIANRLIQTSISTETPVLELAGRQRPSFPFYGACRDCGAQGTNALWTEVVDILTAEVAADPTLIG
jgi:hypothetical protein